jgi:hypothetical protein
MNLKQQLSNFDKKYLIDCIFLIEIKKGDLLDATEDYIIQQVNATGNRNMGLASSISKRYPTSNLYSGKFKVSPRVPGTIIIRDKVINIVGQINPGKPSGNDSVENRIHFFKNALNSIPRGIKSIAFPMGIGCGLAGGSWNTYFKLIQEFKSKRPEIKIAIYNIL